MSTPGHGQSCGCTKCMSHRKVGTIASGPTGGVKTLTCRCGGHDAFRIRKFADGNIEIECGHCGHDFLIGVAVSVLNGG